MHRILVGVDASPRAPQVIAAAVDLAQRLGAKLRLLRAVGLPAELPSNVWAMPPSQVIETFLSTARAELNDLAARVPPELLESATVQVGVPWDAICSSAREYDADLIVVGSHGYGLIDRIIGTTASRVVFHADRSVLVVRF
ncbi:MAG: universal stress protein [Polyangiaceae bacterium]|nr:universal stress protein [Polyangiaceae bacterium]